MNDELKFCDETNKDRRIPALTATQRRLLFYNIIWPREVYSNFMNTLDRRKDKNAAKDAISSFGDIFSSDLEYTLSDAEKSFIGVEVVKQFLDS